MSLEGFANLPATWNTEGVQHYIDRSTVLKVGHVFARHDPRDHAFVAMTARHLISGLQLAFNRDEDLDHLHYPRRELVPALKLFDLALKTRDEARDGILHLVLQGLNIRHPGIVAD